MSCLLMRLINSSSLRLFRGSCKDDLLESGEAARAAEARREESRMKRVRRDMAVIDMRSASCCELVVGELVR